MKKRVRLYNRTVQISFDIEKSLRELMRIGKTWIIREDY